MGLANHPMSDPQLLTEAMAKLQPLLDKALPLTYDDAALLIGLTRVAMPALLATLEVRTKALRQLVDAKALAEVPGIVTGWRGPAGQSPPHPSRLGATIKTNCGAMYALEAAIADGRAALAGKP